jgi:hypothetical protein
METFKLIVDIVSIFANVIAATAGLIAIYVFFFKGPELKAAFVLLLNWSFQLTLTDLKTKLERLNEYNAKEASEIDEIRNILHEIAGQIRGNKRIASAAPSIASRLEDLAKNRKLSEPLKRSMVSELREILRNIEVNSLTSQNGVNDD